MPPNAGDANPAAAYLQSQTSAWRNPLPAEPLPGPRALFPAVFESLQEPAADGPGQSAQAEPNPPASPESPHQRPAELPAQDTAPAGPPQAVDLAASARPLSECNDEILQKFLPLVDDEWNTRTGDAIKRTGKWLVKVATKQGYNLRGGSIRSRIEPTLATRFPEDRLRAPAKDEHHIRNIRTSMGHAADLLTRAVHQLATPSELPLQALSAVHRVKGHRVIAPRNLELAPPISEPKNRHDAVQAASRPIVQLSSWEDVVQRSWNAGDRFSLMQGGAPATFEVRRHRQQGDALAQGEFSVVIRGG